ncbi:hypothetical protein QBC41DRAFT_370515 [Cercophora samala]|uniref:Uncharacterized protein n=1 Tax=Cercophora samala TaxID=330535 RepID=A0AA39ZLZ1_9PEZI|nr:hypothetical protein QBC41DRAFT_370515 [Cercophora samala]
MKEQQPVDQIPFKIVEREKVALCIIAADAGRMAGQLVRDGKTADEADAEAKNHFNPNKSDKKSKSAEETPKPAGRHLTVEIVEHHRHLEDLAPCDKPLSETQEAIKLLYSTEHRGDPPVEYTSHVVAHEQSLQNLLCNASTYKESNAQGASAMRREWDSVLAYAGTLNPWNNKRFREGCRLDPQRITRSRDGITTLVDNRIAEIWRIEHEKRHRGSIRHQVRARPPTNLVDALKDAAWDVLQERTAKLERLREEAKAAEKKKAADATMAKEGEASATTAAEAPADTAQASAAGQEEPKGVDKRRRHSTSSIDSIPSMMKGLAGSVAGGSTGTEAKPSKKKGRK